MIAQLERAVAADHRRSRPVLPSGATALLAAVRGHTTHSDPDGDDPAEADPALTSVSAGPLAEILTAPRAQALLEQHPQDRPGMEALAAMLLASDTLGLLPDHDPVLTILEERLIADLEQNDYFVGPAQQDFWQLTKLTIRFVKDTLDRAAPYLRPYGVRADAPREKALQDHYATWIGLNLTRVHTEVRDLGSGRADVLVTMRHGSEFAIEIKRDFINATPAVLEANYLGQALEYQGTRLPLGGLLVLDLTQHGAVTPHLSDLLWVAHHSPANGTVMRTALCGVVVGNRPSPSQVRV